MQRRRILGLAMIGIGLIWLTSTFSGGRSRDVGMERNWENTMERDMERWEANFERDMENWERNWEDREELGAMEMPAIPAIPELPAIPAMPDMPDMPHFNQGHSSHWFGWWKLPLLVIGAMLLLSMRRRQRFSHGENYNATIHRF
jgi:hypothetical protein